MGCSTSSRATTTRGGCTPTTTSRVQTKPKPAGAHARWQHNLGVHETGASPDPSFCHTRGTRRSSLALLPCRAEGRSVSPANRVHQAVQRQHEDSAAAGGNDRELHVPGRLVRPLEVGFRDRVAEPSRIDVVDDKAHAELAWQGPPPCEV